MRFKWSLLPCLTYLGIASQAWAQWVPEGQLSLIPVVDDCFRTNGDIAVAVPEGIIYCSTAARNLNNLVPDAGHFYYVHEYGHHALATSSEPAADCWAAEQLSGIPDGEYFIAQWVTYWDGYGVDHPRYGTVQERISNVLDCAGLSGN